MLLSRVRKAVIIWAFCCSILDSSVGALVSEWNLNREADLEGDGEVKLEEGGGV